MSLIERSPESLEALLCRDQHTDYLGLPTDLGGDMDEPFRRLMNSPGEFT